MFPCEVLASDGDWETTLVNPYFQRRVCGASNLGHPKQCYNGMAHVWQTAHNICRSAGARLCTEDELINNVSQGTGCRIDKDLVWAANGCEDGGHIAIGGRNPFLGPAEYANGCRAAPLGASVRCCADKFTVGN